MIDAIQTLGLNASSLLNASLLLTEYHPAAEAFTNEILTEYYGPKRDPLYVVIPMTFVYMCIFVTGFVGNISTCVVIARNRPMHTATNYYLFSLAISDLCLLLAGVPQEVYQIWSKYPYVFGEVFCVLRGLMAETSANATVLTITSFTVERYLAICHPFLQHTMSKLSRAIRLILVVWVVSVVLATPMALQFGVQTNVHGLEYCGLKRILVEHSFEMSSVVMFVVPMTIITILYVLIGLKLRTSCLIKRENGGARGCSQVSGFRQNSTTVASTRVIKMLVAVVVAFFLCWAPFHTQRLIAFYGNDQPILYAIITYTSGILYYVSTCINPLLYNLMSNKFREAFKETLAKCCYQPADNRRRRRHCRTKRTAYRSLPCGKRRHITNQESVDFYSGTSFRDDSLYSTATQKQSFDSMTLCASQSVRQSTYGLSFNTNGGDDGGGGGSGGGGGGCGDGGDGGQMTLQPPTTTTRCCCHSSVESVAGLLSQQQCHSKQPLSIASFFSATVDDYACGVNNRCNPFDHQIEEDSADAATPSTATTSASPTKTATSAMAMRSNVTSHHAKDIEDTTTTMYKRKEEVFLSIARTQQNATNNDDDDRRHDNNNNNNALDSVQRVRYSLHSISVDGRRRNHRRPPLQRSRAVVLDEREEVVTECTTSPQQDELPLLGSPVTAPATRNHV